MQTALQASQTAILSATQNQSVIANNLANITTPAFKKVRQEQSDFVIPGTQVAASHVDFSEGQVTPSSSGLDVAIQGDGFFQVDLNGTEAYTRVGTFRVDRDGNLTTTAGYLLSPQITVPEGAEVEILRDGRVLVQVDGEISEAGQLEVARFPNNQGLVHLGDGLFREAPNSGTPITGNFGEEGFPSLQPRSFEESNVDLAEEFTREIVNQRWFQANIRVFQTTDQMIGEAVDMVG